MIVTLLIVGAVTGKLPWVLIAFGGILLSIFILTVQYIFQKTMAGLGAIPGAEVMQACSLLPVITDTTYVAVPSLWMSLSSFFITYVFINATRVYTATPVTSAAAVPIMQRKGIGLISMFAVVVLFILLMSARYNRSECETLIGTVFGIGIGVGAGWIWWQILNACGSDVFPDIHGVMMGLKPGSLHTGPLACAPKK